MADAVEGVGAPLQRMEHALHGWVAFAIVPIFALANAGVRIEGDAAALGNRVTIGVVLGLVLGKQLGITLAAWLAIRARVTDLPEGVTWRQVYGAGWLEALASRCPCSLPTWPSNTSQPSTWRRSASSRRP